MGGTMLARRLTTGLAVAALLTGGVAETAYAQKIKLPGGQVSKDNSVCAAERAPLLERKKQYDQIRRTRIAKAAGEGIKKGATFFAGAMLSRYGLPGVSSSGGSAGNVVAGAGAGGMLGGVLLSDANGLSIPGVTIGAAGGALGGMGADAKTIAAVSVVVAIAGTVEAYVRLKQQEAGGDRYRMARAIDGDARLQIDVSRAIAAEQAALSACLARQITDLQTHLASASNDQDRRSASQRRSQLTRTLKSDVELTSNVTDQQATLAKTFTQGRAMTENRSEAEILGGQAPAYAERADDKRLDLPPMEGTQPAGQQPAVQQVTYVAARPTDARAQPNAKSKSLAKLTQGQELQVKEATRGDWTAVAVGSQTGYVRASDITRTTGPQFVAASNIREHNRAVIQAREQGPNRLKSLMTTMQST